MRPTRLVRPLTRLEKLGLRLAARGWPRVGLVVAHWARSAAWKPDR